MDEMSVKEKAKYGGSFTLADDGHWHTNADTMDELEMRAMEIYSAEAFAEAEAACLNRGEEGSLLQLSQSWDSAMGEAEHR